LGETNQNQRNGAEKPQAQNEKSLQSYSSMVCSFFKSFKKLCLNLNKPISFNFFSIVKQ